MDYNENASLWLYDKNCLVVNGKYEINFNIKIRLWIISKFLYGIYQCVCGILERLNGQNKWMQKIVKLEACFIYALNVVVKKIELNYIV